MLRLKVIACDVLNREISFLASQSECFIDVTFLHQGLHCTPEKLKIILQNEINIANNGFPYNHYGYRPDYDYIIMGYGLCSNGVVGISSSKIPLVIPKGHDCITILLGSRDRYKDYFDANPGSYWYSGGWIDRGNQPSEERYMGTYKEYLEKYGEENAEYLMDMEQHWMKDYKNAAFINWNCLGNSKYYRNYTLKSAKYLNWRFDELEGDSTLLKKILNGIFDEKEVLIVPKGKKVVQSFNDEVIKVE